MKLYFNVIKSFIKIIIFLSISDYVFSQSQVECSDAEKKQDADRSANHFFLKKKQGGCRESKVYFNTLSSRGLNRTTLSNFKIANGYDSTKAVSAQYYNNGDLGFGRGMVCWSKDANSLVEGTKINHLACYVGNYGVVGSNGKDQFISLSSARQGHKPFATVAMEFNRNDASPIAFFAYDANGNSVSQVELDSEGQKYIPGACTVCHGGKDPMGSGTIVDANFLPFDFNTFKFLDEKKVVSANDQNKDHAEIKSQLINIKKLNILVKNQQIGNSDSQITNLINNVLYPAPDKVEKLKYDDLDFSIALAERFCRGCHIAHKSMPYDNIKASALGTICNNVNVNTVFAMPHAELNAAHAYDFARARNYCGANNKPPVQSKYVPKPRDPATPIISVSAFNASSVVVIGRKFRDAGNVLSGRPKFFPMDASGAFNRAFSLFTVDTSPFLSSIELTHTAWVVDVVKDFNGDNINDLIWRNYRTGENKIYYISDTFGVSGVRNLNSIPVNYKILGAGNFDGKGLPDILWFDENTGSYFVQDIDNIHTPLSDEAITIDNKPFNNTLSNSYDFVGVGNFGGTDAKQELLFKANILSGADHGNLYAVSFNSSSITIASSNKIESPSDDNWFVAAIGDMNNDGYDDIIFRNIVTSDVWFYWISQYKKNFEGPILVNGVSKVPSDWVLVGAAKKRDNLGNPLVLVWRNIASIREGNIDKAHYATWSIVTTPTDPVKVTETISKIEE